MGIRNYSECTVRCYVSMLSQMSSYLDKSPDQVSRDEFKSYAYHLINDRGFSASSINILISAWRILQVDVLCRDWEAIRIKRARVKRQLPEVLSQHEVRMLLDSLTNVKHRTILSLTYSTGMRRAEAVQLKLGDISSERMVVRIVRGKGGKTREVPLPASLLEGLRDYYRQYRPEKYLFEGRDPGTPYSVESFGKVVKRAARSAGLRQNVSPHILRHCFASHMLERGLPLKRLQYLLGHSSLSTTFTYIHLLNPADSPVPDLLSTSADDRE